mmetsp:Transcript_125714/g.402359  ORF Transcript_125714/g.402359 Transcript_125714/m.402359 type:complete len:406 (-) Transcript_125714:314-1531(-)
MARTPSFPSRRSRRDSSSSLKLSELALTCALQPCKTSSLLSASPLSAVARPVRSSRNAQSPSSDESVDPAAPGNRPCRMACQPEVMQHSKSKDRNSWHRAATARASLAVAAVVATEHADEPLLRLPPEKAAPESSKKASPNPIGTTSFATPSVRTTCCWSCCGEFSEPSNQSTSTLVAPVSCAALTRARRHRTCLPEAPVPLLSACSCAAHTSQPGANPAQSSLSLPTAAATPSRARRAARACAACSNRSASWPCVNVETSNIRNHKAVCLADSSAEPSSLESSPSSTERRCTPSCACTKKLSKRPRVSSGRFDARTKMCITRSLKFGGASGPSCTAVAECRSASRCMSFCINTSIATISAPLRSNTTSALVGPVAPRNRSSHCCNKGTAASSGDEARRWASFVN